MFVSLPRRIETKATVDEGQFRADLYYRLNVLKIEVAPLRCRKQDLHELVPYFVKQLSQELAMPDPNWAHEDMLALEAHDWPGNVRELKNFIERSLLLATPPAHYWKPINEDTGEASQSSSQVNATLLSPEQEDTHTMAFGYPNEWTLKAVERAHIEQLVDFHEQ
ncbi:sigma-54 dependent response regulator [Vibrio astriarenae]|nr:sigma-54 dependent response regulator [Vibrio sp. C7]